MEREETEQGQGRRGQKPQPRSWTQRTREPLRFRRYADKDHLGRPSIIYRFEPDHGQADLPEEVYRILQSLKHIVRGPEHGGGLVATGLEFKRDPKHGRIWRLPDTPLGRTAADIIDAKLLDLAREMEAGEGRGR